MSDPAAHAAAHARAANPDEELASPEAVGKSLWLVARNRTAA